MVLEDEADGAPAQPRQFRVAQGAGLVPLDEDTPAVRLVEQPDHVEQRALA
jgi:hypothetical protein